MDNTEEIDNISRGLPVIDDNLKSLKTLQEGETYYALDPKTLKQLKVRWTSSHLKATG